MKRVILHIGRHKSGTSSLQNTFVLNAEQLAEQGILYPEMGRARNARGKLVAGHHYLAQLLNQRHPDRNELDHLKADLNNESQSFDTILISSEAFQNLKQSRHITQFFSDTELVVICYLREYLDYCRSSYAQKVQQNNFWCPFHLYPYRFNVNLSAFASFWTSLTPHAHLRLFDQRRLANHSVVDDFFSIINIDNASFKVPGKRRQNPSIAGNLLAFKLLLNKHKLHQEGHGRDLLRIARDHKRLTGKFHINADLAARIRKRSKYNRFLQEMFGDIPLPHFDEEQPIFNPDTWEDDLELFFQHEAFQMFKDHPMLAKIKTLQKMNT